VVFPAHGFTVTGCDGCGGFHASQSTSAFWAVIPEDQEQVVIAHEVFESSADPAVNNFKGWDEAVDQCDSASPISLSFGPIPPAIDNTNGGTCSTTGYTSLDEIQVYGWTYAKYRAEYNTLFPEGWRLYSLQAYVLSDDAAPLAARRGDAGMGDQAYRGQGEVLREHAPHAQDFTNQRYRYKDRIDEVEREKNRTKSKVRSKVE
jgi:hypothetical protein